MRELLANAVYHRGYDVDTPEPTKVHVHSDRMEIVSYPGPVPGVEAEHLLPGANVPAAAHQAVRTLRMNSSPVAQSNSASVTRSMSSGLDTSPRASDNRPAVFSPNLRAASR